jgi:hypothetical protein
MSRDHMNAEELEASRILDLVREGGGVAVPMSAIVWSLWVLGDLGGPRPW